MEYVFRCVDELVGHEDSVLCLEFANDKLYSGSADQTIKCWGIKEMELRVQERDNMMHED